MGKIECSVCGAETTDEIFKLCEKHLTEFTHWKRRQMYQLGDKPNDWALLTAYLLLKIKKEVSK